MAPTLTPTHLSHIHHIQSYTIIYNDIQSYTHIYIYMLNEHAYAHVYIDVYAFVYVQLKSYIYIVIIINCTHAFYIHPVGI